MITIKYEVLDYRLEKSDCFDTQAFIKVKLISYKDDIQKLNIKFSDESYNRLSCRRSEDNLEERINGTKRLLDYHNSRLDNSRYKVKVNKVSSNRDPFYTVRGRQTDEEYSLRLPANLETCLRSEMYQFSWMGRNEVGFQIMLDIYEELMSRIRNDRD